MRADIPLMVTPRGDADPWGDSRSVALLLTQAECDATGGEVLTAAYGRVPGLRRQAVLLPPQDAEYDRAIASLQAAEGGRLREGDARPVGRSVLFETRDAHTGAVAWDVRLLVVLYPRYAGALETTSMQQVQASLLERIDRSPLPEAIRRRLRAQVTPATVFVVEDAWLDALARARVSQELSAHGEAITKIAYAALVQASAVVGRSLLTWEGLSAETQARFMMMTRDVLAARPEPSPHDAQSPAYCGWVRHAAALLAGGGAYGVELEALKRA